MDKEIQAKADRAFGINLLAASKVDDRPPQGLVPMAMRKYNPADIRVMPHVFRNMTLVDPDLQAVFRGLVSGRLPWPLFLWGDPGVGKTAAALSLCDFAKTAMLWPVGSLGSFVMRHPAEVDAEYRAIGEKDLFVLDELGTRVKVTDLEYSIAKDCLDLREQHAGRLGIYISNLPGKDIGELYDRRIQSRLTCGTTFELKGGDRRGA